jgi:hypothetical protein
MEEIMNRWLGSVAEAARLARGLAASIVVVWLLLPFTAQLVAHPDDVIRLQHRLDGEAIPSVFGAQQLFAGEVMAWLTLAALVLLLLGLLTVLYHRLQFAVTLYPVAGIAFGVIGNLLWAHALGFADVPGMIAGLFPAVLTVIWQRAAEGWAQNFVFGRGNRPPYAGAR